VAYEIAEALDAPLDVFVVRKLGLPGQPEFAIGALASGGVRVWSTDIVDELEVPQDAIDALVQRGRAELERRERAYRPGRPPIDPHDRIVILVDDGLATGSSMRAAVDAVRAQRPTRIVVASPVGPPSACDALAAVADEVVCARRPEHFAAVGQFYEDFSQT